MVDREKICEHCDFYIEHNVLLNKENDNYYRSRGWCNHLSSDTYSDTGCAYWREAIRKD